MQFISINLIFLLFLSKSLFASTGLEISIAADMLFDHGLNESSNSDDMLSLRGAEMMFYAPIDHQFSGVLSAAAHDENGESNFELHEAFVTSNNLIPNSTLKFGQFFLGLGRLNRFHQHDWPITSAPKVHGTFFDDEGVFDNGAEIDILLPFDSFWNLSLGSTNGRKWGHAHSNTAKPKQATIYTRLSTFLPSGTTGGKEFGFNYVSRIDDAGVEYKLAGIDFISKEKTQRLISKLFQSELWYRNSKAVDGTIGEEIGVYLISQFYLTGNWQFGTMIDSFKELTRRNSITNNRMNNIYYGINPYLTYSASEFSKFRLGIQHTYETEEGDRISEDNRIQAQFIFIIGSHPAHIF